MKKQLLALAVLTAGIANAQVWSENFSGTTAPALPTNWVEANLDLKTTNSGISGLAFGTKGAVTYNFATNWPTLGRAVAMTSYYTPAGTANDYLMTPSFTVPVNGFFEWDAVSQDGSAKENYEVLLSIGTGTATAGFSTTLLPTLTENSTITHRAVALNTYSNQVVRIAFHDNTNDQFFVIIDNVAVVVPVASDVALTSVTPIGQNIFGATATTKNVTGIIKNNGINAITTFTAKYSANGGAAVSQVFTIPSLAYGASSSAFTFATPYTIATPNEASLKIWADVTGDAMHTNDTLKTSAIGYSFLPPHIVTFEEGTGTWCGWCPRGTVYMDSMHLMNPNTTALIAVHNGDPMTNATYDGGIGALIGGYPTALCDRAKWDGDPSDIFNQLGNHENDFALAELGITKTYNTTTRVAGITVTTKMASGMSNNTASNDYRLAVVFTEDGVKGSASGYNQTNYYGGSSNPLKGAGRDWQTSPNPVLAANISYDFVARTILGGFTGQASSLPGTLVSGTTYTSTTFNYTIPTTYNAGKMKAIALLIDAKTNVIYNAVTTTITPLVVGVNEVETEKVEVSIYPNPAKNNSNIELNLTKDETVTINVLSVMGQVVYTQTLSNLKAGKQTVSLNTENWAAGIYNVNISTSNGNVSRKLDIIK